MSEKTLIRVQAISGLVFGVFLVLHLSNLLAGVLGQARYDGWMRAVRGYYQFPVVEVAGVLGAAVIHMGAGVALAIAGALYPVDQQRFDEWKSFAEDYVPEAVRPW